MNIVNTANLNEVESNALVDAVLAASERWRSAFNRGDAKAAAAQYEEDAWMHASPLANVRGRDAIEQFWQQLVEQGFAEVEYVEPSLTLLSATSARLGSGWRMNNAQGVITNELWVIQDDGSALLREDEFEVQG